MTNHDPIDSPAHYAEGRVFEPIDVIADWELNYHLGNCLKYVSRAGRKQNQLEDLKKARWYLSREIETLEATPIVTYEDILKDAAAAAAAGEELLYEYRGDLDQMATADVDDQPLSGWDWDDDYMWDPSLGPVEISEEEVKQILSKKDLGQFGEDEIVSTVERRGLIIGFKRDGSSCLLNNRGRCE
jgi:hypothetical protein